MLGQGGCGAVALYKNDDKVQYAIKFEAPRVGSMTLLVEARLAKELM